MRQDLAASSAVVVARLARPTPPNPADPVAEGVTDLVVGKVLKTHPAVARQKTIVLNRYLTADKMGSDTVLVGIDVDKGKFDPWWGKPVRPGSDLAKYVEGILKVSEKKPAERLRYFFDYLPHAETEIADDALLEFETAEYRDLRKVAATLPPDKLGAWLADRKTPARRVGMYALLLGHCSKDSARDAELLRAHLGRDGSYHARDFLLIGLVLLQPKEGWQAVREEVGNPSKEFMSRFLALRAARFLAESRPDVVAPDEVVRGITPFLDQPDISDIVVEDLRRWQRWEMTGRVLALRHQAQFKIPILERALVRFALGSPAAEAKAFVEEQRRLNPDRVSDAEELLALEAEKQ